MTPQELKNSILQLAIQGKLVEQRADEGTGVELLEKILAAKNAKDAKGRGNKLTHIPRAKRVCEADALAGVSRGVRGGGEDEGISNLPKAAKSHPGKFSASPREEIPDDEKPFDIPESWEWVRLGEVVFNHGQKKPTEDFSYVDIGSIDNKYQTLSDTENIIKPEKASPRARKIIQKGDILYSTVRPYLHNICIVDREFSREPIASTGFAVMACSDCLDNRFLFYFLLSPDFDRYANSTENAKGVAYPAISDKRLYNATIPLPPLAEQKRIVAKIEELMPLVDRYEKAWSRLEDFNKRFPVDMQKSLLQMAIQGKLVEQRADEGTGVELLEKILAAKSVEGAKGKGEKFHAKSAKSAKVGTCVSREEIPDDEKPFDIPESWEWVRLGEVFAHNTGKAMNSSAKAMNKPGAIRKFITTSNLYWDRFDFSSVKEMFFTDDELERCSVTKNDILVCEGGAYYGRTAIWNYDYDICFQNHIHRLRSYVQIEGKYFYHLLRFYRETGMMKSQGTAMPGLSSKVLHDIVLPLPPLAEQKRIVAKLEELLPLCERLK